MPRDRLDERDAKLLYALIKLQQTEPRAVRALAQAAANTGAFAQMLAAARADVKAREEPERDGRVKEEVWKEFFDALNASSALRELLTDGVLTDDDVLTEEDALKVATFARIADLTPGTREVLSTQDGPFLNALAAVLDRHMTPYDAERLVAEDLGRFLALRKNSPDFAAALNQLESQPHWHVVLASIEENEDYVANIEGANEQESRALRNAAQRDFDAIKAVSQSAKTKLGPMLRLSRMPRSLFRLAWNSEQRLADIPVEEAGTPRSDESIGADALALLRDAGGALEDEFRWVLEGVRLRVAAARHLITEREFAKLDACEYKWPQVMARISSGPNGVEGIIAIESYFLDLPPGVLPGSSSTVTPPPQKSEEEREFYEACMADEGLRRFLRLRPYFKEMDRRRLLERRLSFTFEPGAQTATAAAAAPTITTATPTADSTPITDTQKPPTETPQDTTPLNVTFVIRRKGQLQPEAGTEASQQETQDDAPRSEATEADAAYYSVEVVMANDPGGVEYPAVRLSTNAVLRKMFESRNFVEDDYGWFVGLTKSLAYESDSDYQLTLAGRTLHEEFFGRLFPPEPIDEDFAGLLLGGGGGRQLRFTIRTDAPEVARLPWEMLKTPGRERSLALNTDVSLCRYVGKELKAAVPVLRTDLDKPRVLTTFTKRGELDDIIVATRRLETLQSGFRASGVYDIAVNDTVDTGKYFLKAVREDKPHVLHLEMFAVRTSSLPGNEPALLLGDSDSGPYLLELSEFSAALVSGGVQLLTFGNNPTGGFLMNSLIEMVSGLLRAGLPAAVVATRPVEETSAINFWTGFYRAWLNGKSVEEAVAGARREISRSDWSAFALFGSPSVVGRLSLPRAL
jgi:hypothetical protein